jgi:hypothetical protein
MGTIPECDSGFREEIGNRHHGRTDDAESMLDSVHLQDFDESFLCGHFGHETLLFNAG